MIFSRTKVDTGLNLGESAGGGMEARMKVLRVKAVFCDWSVTFMCVSYEMGRWVDANEFKEDDFIQVSSWERCH